MPSASPHSQSKFKVEVPSVIVQFSLKVPSLSFPTKTKFELSDKVRASETDSLAILHFEVAFTTGIVQPQADKGSAKNSFIHTNQGQTYTNLPKVAFSFKPKCIAGGAFFQEQYTPPYMKV